MDNLGAIVGPLLAIGLVALVGTRWAIGLLSVIPGLLAAAAIVYAIRHTAAPDASANADRSASRSDPSSLGRLGRLFAGITAFEIGNCAATLLILRATELLEPGHGDDSATTIALALYVAYNVAATAHQRPRRPPQRPPRRHPRPRSPASPPSPLAYLRLHPRHAPTVAAARRRVRARRHRHRLRRDRRTRRRRHPRPRPTSAAPRSACSPPSRASATSPPARRRHPLDRRLPRGRVHLRRRPHAPRCSPSPSRGTRTAPLTAGRDESVSRPPGRGPSIWHAVSRGERRDSNPRPPGPQPGQIWLLLAALRLCRAV